MTRNSNEKLLLKPPQHFQAVAGNFEAIGGQLFDELGVEFAQQVGIERNRQIPHFAGVGVAVMIVLFAAAIVTGTAGAVGQLVRQILRLNDASKAL